MELLHSLENRFSKPEPAAIQSPHTNTMSDKITDDTAAQGKPLFNAGGAIGKQFEADGVVGQLGEGIGGPLSSKGAIGKNFTKEGAIGGNVNKTLGEETEKK
ncbi:hypothetical protein EJ05DRAFT_350045 [Pseudovirgaria hyperparasitica]|uniref:Uncharacterized protein n=1 Tax=Pseudovirgaria hyperparasitica TaxID=470096 RepID=A0A6A6W637_9PEZI|nr:uncharacterized protein EJ05DRAFT_350045 [Pseudovirgaria hyperparasitica]KAF2758388.1 hypothetical protein EJ05DRAFT_350045 [Pseudovirgaria hyperparasitica]